MGLAFMAIIGMLPGICLIYLGWQIANNPDGTWKIYQHEQRHRGIIVQRTPEWEKSSADSGPILIILGIGFILFGLCAGSSL